jgi:hypothetical protein
VLAVTSGCFLQPQNLKAALVGRAFTQLWQAGLERKPTIKLVYREQKYTARNVAGILAMSLMMGLSPPANAIA